MTRITIQDITTAFGNTPIFDIVNAITNSNPSTFGQYVPLADANNVTQVGAGIMINQTVQNEFINALVDRIGLVLIDRVSLQNPLRIFKRGQMPDGRTIEEIFTDIAKAEKFDMEGAEETVFKRTIPNVKVLFHELNRQETYPQTISDEDLSTAFTSWTSFGNFLASIINAIYNGAEVDEYKYMKLVIDNYYAKGLFTVVGVQQPNDTTTATAFIKTLRATAKKMTLPMGTRDYNALAVQQRSTMDDLYLLISPDVDAEVEVDVLAKAFHMDQTNFLGHVIVIDNFASAGLEAVLVDRNWFMVYDKIKKMETIRNPKGLYWNYFYHVWQILSASRFANAVAFVSGTLPKVTSVIVTPTIINVGVGKTQAFTATVRQTDNGNYPVVWSVEAGTTSTTVQAGTTIDAGTGILTVAANQTGQLTVKATVDTDPAGAHNYISGESVVTVQ